MSDDEFEEEAAAHFPSSSTAHAYYGEQAIDVEQSIGGLLASLCLEELRHRRTSDQEDEQLRITHQRIHAIIMQDQDDSRRRRLRRALPPSNCVREQIFYLRRLPRESVPAPSYYPRLFSALDCIVKESFDEEYRKVAIILGLVEGLAELLVLELAVFDFPSRNEHRSIRKLIANALTNLTYGHAASKRRLCFYSNFIPTVVRILNEARNLAQVYAGLVRNLSWMADGKMSDVLSPTAKALSRAAVVAHNERDEGCVRAILSALWNLASHSERNKRALCEEPGFLALLTSMLSNDARMTAVVESASGILKYVSQYLSTNSSHLSLRPEMAANLMQLLSSASFTIVANTLGALANLIAKDPHLQSLVRHDAMGMNQLNVLRNSTREDIRAAVKAVLNHLNQPVGYSRYVEMSSSMGCESMGSPRDSRLLALRGMRVSPGVGVGYGCSPTFTVDHRSSSLPRHFTRGGYSMAAHSSPHSIDVRAPISSGPTLGFAPPPGLHHEHVLDEVVPVQPSIVPDEITGDPNLEDSMRCTRSVSAASLGSELPNTSVGWQSCLDTAASSNRMSPVSPSDLPDSPTQCSKIVASKGDTTIPLNISVQAGSGVASSSEQQSGLTASDTPTAIVDDQPTPTFPMFAQHAGHSNQPPSAKGGGLSCFDGLDLLTRSIEAELPQPSPRCATPKHQKKIIDEKLLADMIEAAQPPPRRSRHGVHEAHHSPNVDADRLLAACIDAAMPQPSPSFKSNPKNEKGGRGYSPVTHCVRPSQAFAGHLAIEEDSNQSYERSSFTVINDKHVSRDSSESWSDDDVCQVDHPDITIPLDCSLEDDITIDCSTFSTALHNLSLSATAIVKGSQGLETAKSSSRPNASVVTHKTKLPKPIVVLQKSNRLCTVTPAKKVTKAAVITPYNYRRPEVNDSGTRSRIEKQSVEQVNAGQAMVTTV